MSLDPASFAGNDVNLYRYVSNSAIQKRDPNGEDAEDILDSETCDILQWVDPSAKCGDWDDNLGDIICSPWSWVPGCGGDGNEPADPPKDPPKQCMEQ